MEIFPNESNKDLLERFEKPFLLIIYLIPNKTAANFRKSVFIYIFWQFWATILSPNFAQLFLKWEFFHFTYTNIISNMWKTLPFLLFFNYFDKNIELSQKNIFPILWQFPTLILAQKTLNFIFIVELFKIALKYLWELAKNLGNNYFFPKIVEPRSKPSS